LHLRPGRPPDPVGFGRLIETASIAASRRGLRLHVERRQDAHPSRPTFDVRVEADPTIAEDPLWRYIPERSVQRRPLSRASLTQPQRDALQAAAGAEHEVVWFEGAQRWQWAALLWANGGVRLRLPEAFATHLSVIDWDARFSRSRIPDQALGVDLLTIAVMRHAMANWRRVDFMNRWLGGTLMPRLLMDWIPALACAAHVALIAKTPPQSIDDHVASGRAVQRFWLAATHLGLQHQPAATPLVFARYLREDTPFTVNTAELNQARRVVQRLDLLLAHRTDRTVWLGRIGKGPTAHARSVRRPLSELLV